MCAVCEFANLYISQIPRTAFLRDAFSFVRESFLFSFVGVGRVGGLHPRAKLALARCAGCAAPPTLRLRRARACSCCSALSLARLRWRCQIILSFGFGFRRFIKFFANLLFITARASLRNPITRSYVLRSLRRQSAAPFSAVITGCYPTPEICAVCRKARVAIICFHDATRDTKTKIERVRVARRNLPRRFSL